MVLKKYRNELLNILLQSGFDVNNFDAREYSSPGSVGFFQISLRNSPLLFQIVPQAGNLDLFQLRFNQFAAGFKLEYYPDPSGAVSFSEISKKFAWWLQTQVKPYLDEREYPDYWEIIKKHPIGVKSIDFTKNEPFKDDERELLKTALNEIKGLLKDNFELNREQYVIVEAKINYLQDATERLNRTDWKGILLSAIITISYDLAFNEEKQAKLWGLFAKIWVIVDNLPPYIGTIVLSD